MGHKNQFAATSHAQGSRPTLPYLEDDKQGVCYLRLIGKDGRELTDMAGWSLTSQFTYLSVVLLYGTYLYARLHVLLTLALLVVQGNGEYVARKCGEK